MDADHVEPVIEVLTEFSFRHHQLKLPVGGGDEAHVDRQRLGPAQGIDHPLLDHSQDLGRSRMSMSLISSRNSVPPSACWNFPR